MVYSLPKSARSPRTYESRIQSNNSHTSESIQQGCIQPKLPKEREGETSLLCKIHFGHFQRGRFQEPGEPVWVRRGRHLNREHP